MQWLSTKKGSGADGVVKRVTEIIDELGHPKIILRSDQEPAMKELASELRNERESKLEEIVEGVCKNREIIIIKEHSGVGASQANGDRGSSEKSARRCSNIEAQHIPEDW